MRLCNAALRHDDRLRDVELVRLDKVHCHVRFNGRADGSRGLYNPVYSAAATCSLTGVARRAVAMRSGAGVP